MTVPASPHNLAQMLDIRPLTLDDLSTARYIEASSFTTGAQGSYGPAEIEGFCEFVRSPRYADLLLGNDAYAGWIGNEMVATGAWCAGEAPTPTAQLLALFVRPLFYGEGIGSRLVRFLEEDARAAGYRALEVSATLNAVGFFEGLGYHTARQAAWALPSGRTMSVAQMRKAKLDAPPSI
jgi:GNAT superfamily N-acetyltransferase